MRGAIEPERRGQGGRRRVDPRVSFLLGGALFSSGVLLVALSSRLTWRYDDWNILLLRRDWSAHALLDPQYEHIVVARNAIFKTLLAAFGMESWLPFSVVSILVFLLAAILLFIFLRRRVGDWLALISTTVILFLGAAWEDLLWSIQIVHFGCIACGLGVLLALEREDRTGDRLACALLAGSLSFFSLGFVFVAGAAVDIVQRREIWRRRIYIVAIPCFLYGLWWLGWGHTGSNTLSWHDLGTTPLFALDALAAGIASLLGLVGSASDTSPGSSLVWGRPLLPIVLALAAWRLHRQESVSRWFWIVATIGFSTWIVGGLAQQVGRPPDASRYQYPSAIFILLIAAELMRGVRIGRNAMIGILVVAAASLTGNITTLVDAYKTRKVESELARAALGAVETARDTVPPKFNVSGLYAEATFTQIIPFDKYTPSPAGDGSGVFSINAEEYLKAVDDLGSPAYSPAELATGPELARQVADTVLAAALGIKLTPTRVPASLGAGPRPSLVGPPEAMAGSNANCLDLNASDADPPLLDLPAGGVALVSGAGSGFQVRLRRFASTILPVDLGTLPPHASAVIDIPPDRSTQRWKLSLAGSGRVNVCGLPGRG